MQPRYREVTVGNKLAKALLGPEGQGECGGSAPPPTSDTHWEPQNGTYRRSGSRRQAGMDTSPPKNLKQQRQEQSSCLTFLPTLLPLQGALHWRRGSCPSGHCSDGERSTGATGARSQKENMTSGYLKPGPRPTEWSHLWQGPGGQKT